MESDCAAGDAQDGYDFVPRSGEMRTHENMIIDPQSPIRFSPK